MQFEALAFEQDQPTTALDTLLADAGVPRSLSPEQLQFARENDLRLEDGDEIDDEGDPADGTVEDGQPEEEEESPATLDDFDPTQIPTDASPEWLAKRHQEMLRDYTAKTEGVAEVRRESEQAQAIVAALEDPAQAPAMLAALGYEEIDEAAGGQPEIDDELEFDDPAAERALEQIRQENAELRNRLDTRDQREVEAIRQGEFDDQLAEEMESIEKAEKRELPPRLVKRLTTLAHSTGETIEVLYAEEKELRKEDREVWKKRRQAPRAPGNGSSGSEAVDMTDPKQRRAAMVQAAEKARAAGASSE